MSISTYIRSDIGIEERFFPKPIKENISDLVCEVRIDEYHLLEMKDLDGFIQYQWHHLYENAVSQVTSRMVGRKEHFVVRYIPEVLKDFSYLGHGIILRVIYEISCVQYKNVVIPEFIYPKAWSGIDSSKPIEWRCGYCSIPNEMKNRKCSQCGAPRALLIQEM